MTPPLLPGLGSWANFYVIVGSAAAALTGLQFVVMALIAEGRRRTLHTDINTFGTPTIVHFCAALLISAIISAPWPSIGPVATILILSGSAGVGYATVVLRRAMRTKGYRPVLQDWIWFTGLPLAANAAVVVGAAMLTTRATQALFTIAGATLLLLFVGIHNSWDTVTYIITRENDEPEAAEESS
jgi:hypothetical protein